MPICRPVARAPLWLIIGGLAITRALAQPQDAADVIEVIGTTPLGGEMDADRVAANVQTATAEELRRKGALDLGDFMKRALGSVFVNEVQSNPLQPDLQYRGFVGSPLLGLPQGLAVYQDGVRINEPFGDTVNWALLPESAIDSVYLAPGSNPLFGLNALGGAIAVRTKDGTNHAGTRAELLGGSFGRFGLQVETGRRVSDAFDYFVTAAHLEEDGWRDFSLTDAQQLFGKLRLHGERSQLDVSFTHADTDLVGNGAAPIDLLDLDRNAIFTHPDHTWNRLAMLNVTGEHAVAADIELRGNLYVRHSDIDTLNGDDSDFGECTGQPGFICEMNGSTEELLLDALGSSILAATNLIGATINRTRTAQDGTGFGLQAALRRPLGGRDNELTLGLVHDNGDVRFAAESELGMLDFTRLAVSGGVFVGEAFTELDASTENTGVYIADVLALGSGTTLTLSGRFNRTDVVLEDRLGDELSGSHRFERFNPAVGVTAALNDGLTLYAGYSEANRAPSPVELTCADEDDPCRLPNAFIADPPLEQVVARTLEAGLRGKRGNLSWNAGVFSATNDDDILFISAGALTNAGFFANVGKTRREGIEINLSGAGERVTWTMDLTNLAATFRDDFTVASPNNPAAVAGEIPVEAGDRLPLVPERLIKAGIDVMLTPALSLGVDALAASGAHFRGDEGNLLDELGSYALLTARAEYRFGERASLFFLVDNLLDEDYSTFGLFGDADDVLGDDFDDPRFVGPGAPRAAWLGVRVQF